MNYSVGLKMMAMKYKGLTKRSHPPKIYLVTNNEMKNNFMKWVKLLPFIWLLTS